MIDYVAMAVIWGLSFLLLLKVVQAFGWAGAVAFRCFIATAILAVIAVVSRRRLAFGRWWPRLLSAQPPWLANWSAFRSPHLVSGRRWPPSSSEQSHCSQW